MAFATLHIFRGTLKNASVKHRRNTAIPDFVLKMQYPPILCGLILHFHFILISHGSLIVKQILEVLDYVLYRFALLASKLFRVSCEQLLHRLLALECLGGSFEQAHLRLLSLACGYLIYNLTHIFCQRARLRVICRCVEIQSAVVKELVNLLFIFGFGVKNSDRISAACFDKPHAGNVCRAVADIHDVIVRNSAARIGQAVVYTLVVLLKIPLCNSENKLCFVSIVDRLRRPLRNTVRGVKI